MAYSRVNSIWIGSNFGSDSIMPDQGVCVRIFAEDFFFASNDEIYVITFKGKLIGLQGTILFNVKESIKRVVQVARDAKEGGFLESLYYS